MMHLPNIEIALEGEMNKLPKKPRNEEMYKAILTLKSLDECMRFFDDLCTVTELMARDAELATLSNQKVSALVNALVKDGVALKVPDGRKSTFCRA
jgi:hypothetical protein